METKTEIKGFEQYIYKTLSENESFEYEVPKDQTLYKFDNGFGASVIYCPGSYGFEQGLVELAVVRWVGNRPVLSYDTYLADDVLGNLNEEQVKLTLQKIKEL